MRQGGECAAGIFPLGDFSNNPEERGFAVFAFDRHSGESRNPFAGASEHTAAFHSLPMREYPDERRKA